MIKINVISNNVRWKNFFKEPNDYVENKINNINKKDKIYKKKKIYCTLLLSNEIEIIKLNKKFRNKKKSTDILSFPFYKKRELKKKLKKNEEIYLGDIIINLDKIKSKKNKRNFNLEFDKLLIHGLVHLLGYDHKKDKDYNNMLKVEKKFLSYLN